MPKNNLIPFTQFAEECFFNEGGADDLVYSAAPDKKNSKSHLKTKEDIIMDANVKRLRKYRETLEAFTITFNLLKIDGEVFIPSNQKEAVKWIVDHYTSPVIRTYRLISNKLKKPNSNVTTRDEDYSTLNGFRINNFKLPAPSPFLEELDSSLDKLELTELRTVIQNISSILKEQLDGNALQQEMNSLYRNSMFMFREVLDHVYGDTVPSIIEVTKSTMYFAQNGTTLNDLDRLILLQYYMSLINHVNDQFRKVTDIAAQLRNEELVNISFIQSSTPEQQVSSQLWYHLSDFREVLEQAIEIYKEE